MAQDGSIFSPLFHADGDADSSQTGFFSNLDDIRTEMKRLIAQSKIGDLKLQEMETLIQGLEADRSKLRAKVGALTVRCYCSSLGFVSVLICLYTEF